LRFGLASVCATILLILSLNLAAPSSSAQLSEFTAVAAAVFSVNYTLHLDLERFGFQVFDLDMANVTDVLDYQSVRSFNISFLGLQPLSIDSKIDADGNPRILLHYERAPWDPRWANITLSFSVQLWDQRWEIPDEIPWDALDTIPSDIVDRYTRPQYYIDSDNETLQLAANQLRGADIISTIRNIATNLTERISYQAMTEEHKASWAWINRVGDCSEFSYLTAALLRALGIPARVVAGWALFTETGDQTNQGHAWNEVYLPNLGWIPLDVTWHSLFCCGHFALVRGYEGHDGPFVANASGLLIGLKGLEGSLSITVNQVDRCSVSAQLSLSQSSANLTTETALNQKRSASLSTPLNEYASLTLEYTSITLVYSKLGDAYQVSLVINAPRAQQLTLLIYTDPVFSDYNLSIEVSGSPYTVSDTTVQISSSDGITATTLTITLKPPEEQPSQPPSGETPSNQTTGQPSGPPTGAGEETPTVLGVPTYLWWLVIAVVVFVVAVVAALFARRASRAALEQTTISPRLR